ncbi:MAG: hypothetical protein HWE25_05760 [Alphaproteobacteria bacterium]|nr:hypothetical protein [Alphaproteobacteria bacterium]
MTASRKMIRKLSVVACLSVCGIAVATTGSASANSFAHDEDAKAEKTEKRRVRVVKSGEEPVTVVGANGRTVIASSQGLVEYAKEHKEALEKAAKALNEVTARLGKSKSKGEKAALEAAKAGLEAAILSLENQRVRDSFTPHTKVEIARIEADSVAGALKALQDREHEIRSMRGNLKEELAEAREEIAEALGDLDLELDLDGDVRVLRLESLHSAKRSLELMEEEQLEALKRAEEEIKRERARIEERMKKREQEKARDNK